jgi:hypothetical protein
VSYSHPVSPSSEQSAHIEKNYANQHASQRCQKGDNDEYGCCPEGEICTGDGGAEFIDESTDSNKASSNSGSNSSDSDSSENAAGSLNVGSGFVVVVAAAAAAALL